ALNNNYLIKRLLEIPGLTLPYGQDKTRLDQARYSWEELTNDTGVGTGDLERRVVDYGVENYFPSHVPWIVPEPMTLEPAEPNSKDDLDAFAAILATVAEEARTDPDLVKNAPYNSTIDQIDYAAVADPARWAFTSRA